MEINKAFGYNVKYFRFKKKYSQERLAELTSTSTTYISQLEQGQHSPSFEKLESLARALGVEEYEFYIKRDFQPLPRRFDMAHIKE